MEVADPPAASGGKGPVAAGAPRADAPRAAAVPRAAAAPAGLVGGAMMRLSEPEDYSRMDRTSVTWGARSIFCSTRPYYPA